MCGRIACALNVDDLSCATACKLKEGNIYVKTKLHKSTLKYQPSFNIPPTASVPVLVSGNNIHPQYDEKLIVCMRFGIIPPWLKSENVKSYNYETHLCKVERMQESKLYGPLFEKGYRCAIPCVGYYEWQSTKGENRQPYFFYNKNNSIEDLKTNKILFDENKGWTGLHLLYLAGIFSKYRDSDGNEAFSFAIITTNTNEEWKDIHHRMPVVLQSDQHVHDWIKFNNPSSSVFHILKESVNHLTAHPVDKTIVNKTKNNMASCIFPIEFKKSSNQLMSWLSDNKKNTSVKNESNKNMKKRMSLDSWLSSAQKKPKNE